MPWSHKIYKTYKRNNGHFVYKINRNTKSLDDGIRQDLDFKVKNLSVIILFHQPQRNHEICFRQ